MRVEVVDDGDCDGCAVGVGVGVAVEVALVASGRLRLGRTTWHVLCLSATGQGFSRHQRMMPKIEWYESQQRMTKIIKSTID